MRRQIAKILALLLFFCCLWGTAAAADFEALWGKGLSLREASAREALKQAARMLCKPGDSDLVKARKLNRFVCDTAAYDDTYTNASDVLAAFVFEKKGVCTGYAGALSFLLDCANIKNFTITDFVYTEKGDKILHIWNTVYINGRWLHIDPTWNDGTRSEAYPDGRYFLLDGAGFGTGRRLPLRTPEEYDRFYGLMRTITLPLSSEAYLPAQKTLCALGGYVKEEEGELTAILGTKTLTLTPDDPVGLLDGEEIDFGLAPQIVEGTMMMPTRPVLAALGVAARFDEAGEAKVTYDPYAAGKATPSP